MRGFLIPPELRVQENNENEQSSTKIAMNYRMALELLAGPTVRVKYLL